MSGSIANLDIKIDVKSIKEALPLLEKLAAVSQKVEKQTESLVKTVAKGARSPDSIDKQAERNAKALVALERNLERGAKRYEEIQRAMNRQAIGDKLRLDLQNRLVQSFNNYNKVIGNTASSQREVAAATRQYENATKGLNESIKTTTTLERQKAREIAKNTAEQIRATKEIMKGSNAVVRASIATGKAIESSTMSSTGRRSSFAAFYGKQIADAEALQLKYIRSEAEHENRRRDKLAADMHRYFRSEADAENKQRDKLLSDKQKYFRSEAEAENRHWDRRAADKQRYTRAEAEFENRRRDKLSSDVQKYFRSEAEAENRQRDKLATDKFKYMRSEADLENRTREQLAVAKQRYLRAEAEYENKYREKTAADKQRYTRAEADEENRLRNNLAAAKYRYMRQEADFMNREYDKQLRLLKKNNDGVEQEDKRAATRRQNEATRNAIVLERALQTAQTRASGVNLRAGRQLDPIAANTIQASTMQALRQYEAVLRASGVGSQQAATASGQFQRTMQGLSSEIARVNGLLPSLDKNARTISASFGAANASLGGFSRLVFSTSAALASLAGALGLREIVQASMEYDRFSNTLKTVSVTTADYRRNLNYLLAEGDRIGFNVGEVGNSFARMSVAMKGANFSSDQTREAFTNLTTAARNFGLSSADTMGIIRALEQSLSKGKFMAEEVRLQMGDRLPIAMAALNAALQKVDGKLSNVSDRFEQGSIDVQRYALEFTRQISIMSGGASALERTSNSIAASFGRFGNEMQRSLAVFKEEGFDAAVINTTNSLTRLMAYMREHGAVEAFAKAIETITKNLDILAIMLAALMTNWLVRFLVSIGGALLRLNKIAAVLGIVTAAVAFLGTRFYSSSVAVQKATESFNASMSDMDKSLDKIKNRTEEVNQSMQNGFRQTTSVAKTEFEKMIEAQEKQGFSATESIKRSMQAQAEAVKVEMAKMKVDMEKASSAIEKIFLKFKDDLQPEINKIMSSNPRGKDPTGLNNYVGEISLIVERAAEGKTKLADMLVEIQNLRDATLAKTEDATLIKQINSLTDLFLKKFSSSEVGTALTPLLNGLTILNDKLMSAGAHLRELLFGIARLGANQFPQDLGNELAANGQPIGAAPIIRFNYGLFNPRQKQQNSAKKFLQDALLTTQLNGIGGQNIVLKDQKEVEAHLTILRDAALGTGRAAAGAREILKGYNEELEKGDKKTGERRKTLQDYENELDAHIAQNYKIIEAYKQSREAGQAYEDQIEAIREVAKYIKPTYDAAGKAIGVFGEAVKKTVDRKKELQQQERDIDLFKDSQYKAIENEIELMKKEQSLLGENIQLREEELEVLKRRQELTKDGKVDKSILDAAEEQIRRLVRGRRELNYMKDSYNELAKVAENAFDRVAESITDAFARGEISALKFGDIARALIADIMSRFVKLALLNPIMNSLFPTDTIRPTLYGAMGISGAAGGGGFGGIGGLGLGNLTSFLPGGGIGGWFSGVGSSITGYIFGSAGVSPGLASMFGDVSGIGAMASPGTPGMFGLGGQTLFGGAAPSFGGMIGGIGAGFGVGNMLGGLIANSSAQRTNAMIGSAIGSLIGAIGGPVGSIIGGLIGGAGGGLIGPGETVKGYGLRLQSSAFVEESATPYAMGTSLLPVDRKYYNESGAAAFQEADQVVAATNAYLAQRNLLVGGASIISGNKDGPDGKGFGTISEGFANLRFSTGTNAVLDKSLEHKSFTDLSKLQEWVEGFLAAEETLKQLAEEPISQFQSQMDALIKNFDEASETAKKYGLAEDNLTVARGKAIQALYDQRIETLRQINNSLEYRRLVAQGKTEEAELFKFQEDARLELQAFEAQLKSLGLTAAEVSGQMVALEEVQAMERAAILAKYAEQANNELRQAIENIIQAGGGIREFINSLMSTEQGNLSIQDRFASSQTLFTEDLALARINDEDALRRITQSAGTYLENARGMYASSPEYFAIQDSVIAQLEDLPSVKSYDQQIRDGIIISNQLLQDQNDISNLILNASNEYAVASLLVTTNAILANTQTHMYGIAGVTHQIMYDGFNYLIALGQLQVEILFSTLQANYAINAITHEMLAQSIEYASASYYAMNILLFENIKAIVDVGGATNTLLADTASVHVQIALATHTLMVAEIDAINSLNVNFVLGINTLNTNIVAVMNALNTNFTNIGNAFNTNIVNGFIATNRFQYTTQTDMNTHLTAIGRFLFSISEHSLWIKENTYRTTDNTAHMLNALNIMAKLSGPAGTLGVYQPATVLPAIVAAAEAANTTLAGMGRNNTSTSINPIISAGLNATPILAPVDNASPPLSQTNTTTISGALDSEEFRQYRIQSAAETAALKAVLKDVQDELVELSSTMSRSVKRGA